MHWHEDYDVVVVGSGAGGLVSAITAANKGLKTLIIEKTAVWGGSSALSGGGLWIPNNHVSKKAGLQDSEEEALLYMETVIEDKGPASTYERKKAYVQNGAKMVKFLEELGMKWVACERYPDYYPEKPGGRIGRSIEGEILDAKELNEFQYSIRKMPGMSLPIPLYSGKVYSLPVAFTNLKSFTRVMGMFATAAKHKLQGSNAISIGAGLVSRLLKIALEQGAEIRLSTPLKDLIIEDRKLQGIEVIYENRSHFIKAKSVILASGGFEHNEQFRRKYHGIGTEWTSGSNGNTGDILTIAQKHKLDTALLDDAWWGPTAVEPNGNRHFLVYDRSLPHCIIVDQDGKRYFNESESYTDAGQAMMERQKQTGRAFPSWMIMDSRHRNRYLFTTMLPRLTPKSAIDSGFIIRANTIEELVTKTGINEEGLKTTIERFNGFVEKGFDEDFKRGSSAYDNYYGDPTYKNPNLGKIEKGPFYAVKVYPGDLGTKGGIVANEHGQALQNGIPIEGLYATGNCSASVMGRVYPGPGSTLGPTTVFGFISANHAANNNLNTWHFAEEVLQ